MSHRAQPVWWPRRTIINKKNNETYKATLTLTQQGMDGDVFLDLQFTPEISASTVDLKTTAPKVFQIMSELACHYLYVTGFVNENGELIGDVAASATVQ